MASLSEKVSQILRRLLDHSQMSEADLAKKTEIPQPTVHRLLRGKTPDPRIATLQTLASHFGITLDQLIGERPIFSADGVLSKPEETHHVPIISWEEATKSQNVLAGITKASWADWELTYASVSELAFGLRTMRAASSIRFMENSILIVDPVRIPKDGSFVIVQLANQKEAALKQLVSEVDQHYLRSMVQSDHFVALSEYDKILGVIVETRMALSE